ncbi:uncharacterized protein BT62DRAFT_244040 [Guyanagaster necrorhizus]|uniref:Uncharacterized protein n=1 Tax=Guyanagaster necrorhizus TaxID=856835 RepID=A0A9P8AS26_9AGAR|nr:uncharacterized protein BT62DRAFT_244040 [Guyanagaster necrorhizus MCA 3950]KAG7444442.1 hypothetical protein BT62DRAFT_244040 [Guyanagaster necrorhizus MCA 3950]
MATAFALAVFGCRSDACKDLSTFGAEAMPPISFIHGTLFVGVMLLNQVLYLKSTKKPSELTQQLGSKLSPLTNQEDRRQPRTETGLIEIIGTRPLIRDND